MQKLVKLWFSNFGLHFKIPFIEQVKRLDARLQTLDGDPDRFVTSEKRI